MPKPPVVCFREIKHAGASMMCIVRLVLAPCLLRPQVFRARMIMAETPVPIHAAARWYSAPALWRTLGRVAVVAGRQTLTAALVLFYCLKDRDTPAWARGIIVGALGYLVLPLDMVPDMHSRGGLRRRLGGDCRRAGDGGRLHQGRAQGQGADPGGAPAQDTQSASAA